MKLNSKNEVLVKVCDGIRFIIRIINGLFCVCEDSRIVARFRAYNEAFNYARLYKSYYTIKGA